jgi:Rho-binding antiterminator
MMSCQQHDCLEIACLYNLPIKLSLRSGNELKGTAVDTQWNEHKEECMVITVDSKAAFIPLSLICQMESLTKNRHFSVIIFD